MNKPKISVIVPVYNAQVYLKQCIESILTQTLANFELILVNDGSQDKSAEICDEYALRDSRICVIHQDNRGQAAARNRAFKQAVGEWICFVDSDDLIHPQMLELLYGAVVTGGVHMSICGYTESHSVSDPFFRRYDTDFQIVTMDESALVDLYEEGRYPAWIACNKMIHRSIMEASPFTDGRIYEDNAVVCKWVYQAQRAAVLPYELYFYRINSSGTTKRGFNLKKLDYLWALKEIISFFSDVNYHALCVRFCKAYISNALYFHQLVKDELKEKALAHRMRGELLRFVFKRRKYLDVSETMYIILEKAYPELFYGLHYIKRGIRNIKTKVQSFMRKDIK